MADHEREKLLEAILDGISSPIIVVNREFNLIYANKAARKNEDVGKQSFCGEKCFEIFYGKGKPCDFCPTRGAFERGEEQYVVLNLGERAPGKEQCFQELRSFPLLNGEGDVEKVVEITKDVTAEKLLEKKLIDSERLISLGEIAAGLAHEINNPIGIILGFTRDLLSETNPIDPHYRTLQIIEKEAGRCEKVIRDLLSFVRPVVSHYTLSSLNDLIEKSVELLTPQMRQGQVKIVKKIPPDLSPVYVDPHQIQQVLVNVLLNAVQAMPSGGEIQVSCVREGKGPPHQRYVRVDIKDTGEGIRAEDLPKVFDPFFSKKKKRGSGLGLSICKRIVEAHAGRIELKSSLGKGTCCSIWFPVERRKKARPMRARPLVGGIR